jgi:integrase
MYEGGLARLLRDYLEGGRPALCTAANERALLVGDRGRRLGLSQIWKIVRAYTKAVDLVDVAPHRLRAAFATHLLDGGAAIEDVGRLLGQEHLAKRAPLHERGSGRTRRRASTVAPEGVNGADLQQLAAQPYRAQRHRGRE